jgi:hypothetical protein
MVDEAASEEGGEVGGRDSSENAARYPASSMVNTPGWEERATPEGRTYFVEYVSLLPPYDSKSDGFEELIRALSSVLAQPRQPDK